MSRQPQAHPSDLGHMKVMEDDEDTNGSYESDEDEDEEIPWIMWFCSLKGNEFFCEVDEDFIQDEFNLTGLSSMVPFYDNAVDMIMDLETPGEEDLTEEQQHMVESAAETLYGLIHARFILTQRGLRLMEDKYRQYHFGRCPRVFCSGQAVLPVGQSDVVRESSVKVFCPKCEEIYYPRSSRHKALDGAFWGTTFPHLLLMQMLENHPPIPRSRQTYVPRIFGFRVRRKDDAGNPVNTTTSQQQQGQGTGGAGSSVAAPSSGASPLTTGAASASSPNKRRGEQQGELPNSSSAVNTPATARNSGAAANTTGGGPAMLLNNFISGSGNGTKDSNNNGRPQSAYH